MKFENLALEWFDSKQNYIKESTKAYYMFALQNYIIPALGEAEVDKLNEDIIQTIVYTWQTQGVNGGNILKKSTISNLVMLIRQIVKYGIKKRVILPFEPIVSYVPEIQEGKCKTFTQEEQNKIVEAIDSDLSFKSFGILLSLTTGIRIGELCALHWRDIDTEQNVIKIQNTLQRVYNKNAQQKTKIIIGNPKTAKSLRSIPISMKLQETMKCLPEIKFDGFILTNSENSMEPRTFRRYYANFLKKHDIRYLNFHCLRHSFATRLIQNGADYKCVSDILGHTNINTTMNMYVHPDLKQKRNCIELF